MVHKKDKYKEIPLKNGKIINTQYVFFQKKETKSYYH